LLPRLEVLRLQPGRKGIEQPGRLGYVFEVVEAERRPET
jgi:hypothetical protein